MARTAVLNRDTNETKIQVALSLDGGPLPAPSEHGSHPNSKESSHAAQATSVQTIEINTGIGFLDHVTQLSVSIDQRCFMH